MPLRTYRKKTSRRHTRRNTRRHTRQCRHTRQGRYRGGNYTDATTKEIEGYPLNPEIAVVTVNGLTMSVKEYLKSIDNN